MIKQAALNCDFGVIAARKIDTQFFAADGNEFHGVESAVGSFSDFWRDFEPFQHWPARRIDAVSTDFLARKFFAFDDKRSQSGRGAKRGAARTRRAASDNRNIDHFHLV
jgi:hypothetical protein